MRQVSIFEMRLDLPRRARRCGLVALAAGLALSRVRRAPSQTSVFPGAPVVLVSIDTLRSDRLPAYGYAEVDDARTSTGSGGTRSSSRAPGAPAR